MTEPSGTTKRSRHASANEPLTPGDELTNGERNRLRAEALRVRGNPVKLRTTIRGRITRTYNTYLTFMTENPDPPTYTAFQHATLDELVRKLSTIRSELIALDEKILDTYDPTIYGRAEVEAEESEIERYDTMLGTMLNAGHLIEEQRVSDLKVKLNQSMVGVAAAIPVATSTPAGAFFPGGSGSHSGTRFMGIKPPEVKLPTFAGDCSLWPSFYDRFMSMIDKDTRWGPCHKLEYLKSCCTGEASRMIAQLSSTDANYVVAMRTLRERFEDEWPTIAVHFDSLLHFKPIHGRSAKDLRRLHEVFTQNCMSLLNLGHNVEGSFLVHILGSKLDTESKELWEREVVALPKHTTSGKARLPDSDRLLEFIAQRARTLERAPGGFQKSTVPGAKKNSALAAAVSGGRTVPDAPRFVADQRKPPYVPRKDFQKPVPGFRKSEPCGHCQGEHRVWTCEAFKNASMEVKKQTIAKARLCFNCMSSGHAALACPSTFKCKVCQRKHHTLLHVEQGKPKQS